MSDLVGRARRIAALKQGDPMPEDWPVFNWAEPLSKLLTELADRIEYLERIAGAVSAGDGDFRTVVQSLKQHG